MPDALLRPDALSYLSLHRAHNSIHNQFTLYARVNEYYEATLAPDIGKIGMRTLYLHLRTNLEMCDDVEMCDVKRWMRPNVRQLKDASKSLNLDDQALLEYARIQTYHLIGHFFGAEIVAKSQCRN